MFYIYNKYFNKFQWFMILNEISDTKKISSKECLMSININNKVKSGEENLRKITLNKYWKEPMAWH
jgi:hypothetical protein